MILNVVVVAVVTAMAALLASRWVASAPLWRATTTPLASIIGSGFLVLGPLLGGAYGIWAILVMAVLNAVAWAFGAAIRQSIADPRPSPRLDTAASVVLAFAYVISVAYYLNLFGAFAVSLTPFDTDLAARTVSTAVFLCVLIVGWTKGFAALERMEQVSVGIKLAIIAGLLTGLAITFAQRAGAGTLIIETQHLAFWPAITLGFGLIVTVQGFETSRFLGESYDAPMRVRSMKLAQLTAAAIYMVYIILLVPLFAASEYQLSETAIIDMMAGVAPVLPLLLVAAALAAQFSAAVADTSGSGGLIAEVTRGRVDPRTGYAVLVGLGIVMTWTLDVFQIIAFASRAFALYYTLQAVVAAQTSLGRGAKTRAFGWAALAIFGALIVVLGRAAEGG
ncbi:MAG: hypothetical protein ACI9U6_003242 [Loktanella salsilacus]|jgi:hypothetical protein|uniref:hypothetical protein n=1 Tax=Loktanella salsilacus TaxID=195913 RepID=UPI0039894EAB